MSANSKKAPPQWHLIYYALAAFDLVTIACSLSLNYQVNSIFQNSTVQNSEWVARSEQYEELSQKAAAVNAPGNDVFDSHDVLAERSRKHLALQEFSVALTLAKSNLAQLADNTQKSMLSERLGLIGKSMDQMTAEADLIFKFFVFLYYAF